MRRISREMLLFRKSFGSTVNGPPSSESEILAKIVQGGNAHFVWEAFVGFNVVFISDQRAHILKRAADLQGPVC